MFIGLGPSSVNLEQLEVVSAILNGDVFVILPTGLVKSTYFQCLPSIFDQLNPEDAPSIVVVVTPLTAIMKDQVSRLFCGFVVEDADSMLIVNDK